MANHIVLFLLLTFGMATLVRANSSTLMADGEDSKSCHEQAPQETSGSFYTSRRLGPHFGIEASGVDLSDPSLINDDQFISQLKQDLVLHRAVLFRSQNLSTQQQVDISDALGTVSIDSHRKHPKSPHPKIYRVSNNSTEGNTRVGTVGWHVDGTLLMAPMIYTALYFLNATEGGNTYFMPLKELYDSFSADKKEYYNKLWMVNSVSKGINNSIIHPMMYKHPFRNDETMMIHTGNTIGYVFDEDISKNGVDNDEEHIINGVDTSKLVHPKFVRSNLEQDIMTQFDTIGMTMEWQTGDFFLFDNVGFVHLASSGTQKLSKDVGLRILHRTTMLGGEETVPTKFDGRKSFGIGGKVELGY